MVIILIVCRRGLPTSTPSPPRPCSPPRRRRMSRMKSCHTYHLAGNGEELPLFIPWSGLVWSGINLQNSLPQVIIVDFMKLNTSFLCYLRRSSESILK